MLQYFRPENQRKIITALCKAGRQDLIGHGEGKLIAPDREYIREQSAKKAVSGAKGKTVKGRGARPPQRRRK